MRRTWARTLVRSTVGLCDAMGSGGYRTRDVKCGVAQLFPLCNMCYCTPYTVVSRRQTGSSTEERKLMRIRRWRRASAVAGLTVCVCALAACGDSNSDGGGGSAANPYIAETRKEMERIAAERGAEMTELDAANDIAKQQQQLQAVIASGRYDGVVTTPLGPALAADVQAAAAAGMKVAVVGQPLGADLDTPDPQVDGD